MQWVADSAWLEINPALSKLWTRTLK